MKRMMAFGLAALLCACAQQGGTSSSGGTTAAAGGPHLRGTLRMAIPQDPKTLNPLMASNSIDGAVWRLMFEPLVSADDKGRPFAMLVSQVPTVANGGISNNGLTVTYRLRPHLTWTDGQPLTSADVLFSWKAVMNPDNNVASRHGYDIVQSIDTPNALTAIVHLKSPMASFVNTFFAESDQPYAIVPAHVLSKDKTINQSPFNNAPTVSDGPFKFMRWAHGDRVVLTANDKFFLGRPNLDGIDVMTVANENTEANQIRTGAIQFVLQPSITTYPQFSNVPGVKVVMNPMNGYEGMGFNLKRAPMSDPRFRLAVAYAIDKARLVKDLTFGQEHIATADLPDWMWANDPSLKPLPHDIAKARALLAQAGVKTPVSLVIVTDSANV
ncbi:MAG TPA: ABC transporter substrate-binding protein, partial [Candidatus Baltobacteraceae bacterium]|nr:ABC transporter substrate-binding protein [Candidatus Baltobacteraceae bacterium]